jgi:hypothetical protein
LNCMRLFLSKLGRWIDVVHVCNVFWFFSVLCFTASMRWSLVLSSRSIQTVWTKFQLLSILPSIDGLPVKAPLGLDTARQNIFLTRSGSFATKRLWTSHALHQSQRQDRNSLSKYIFPCSCVICMDQSSSLSAVPNTYFPP